VKLNVSIDTDLGLLSDHEETLRIEVTLRRDHPLCPGMLDVHLLGDLDAAIDYLQKLRAHEA
jgi:hypothetical protein